MKKILIITRDFPPYSGRGNVMRMLKFSKYLPEFEWQPFIIAEEKDDIEDSTLLKQLPASVKIKYVYSKTPEKRKNEYKRKLKGGADLSIGRKIGYFTYRSVGYNVYALYQNYLMAPDLGLFWANDALQTAMNLHNQHRFDAFLTTGPPFSTFKIGIRLKKQLGIPWVLDFRDGWAGNPIYKQKSQFIINWQNRKIENQAVKNSDLIIFVSDPLKEIYEVRYGEHKTKMVTILNGFDPSDFETIRFVERTDRKLHLLYSGSIGSIRSAHRFLNSAVKALQDEKELKEHLKISFIGRFRENNEFWKEKLPDIFHYEGVLPHNEALAQMSQADVLLFFSSPREGGRTVITGKIFEYLALQKPIFAISHSCAATDLVSHFDAGYITDWKNEIEIKNQILEIFRDWKNGKLKTINNNPELRLFERRNLTGGLSQNLNKITLETQ
jgi:glycosyltransferase involved in cell wall biosynthesis